jgi:hypothetical protein
MLFRDIFVFYCENYTKTLIHSVTKCIVTECLGRRRLILVSAPLKEFWSLDPLDGARHFCSPYTFFLRACKKGMKRIQTLVRWCIFLSVLTSVRPSVRPYPCCITTTAGQVSRILIWWTPSHCKLPRFRNFEFPANGNGNMAATNFWGGSHKVDWIDRTYSMHGINNKSMCRSGRTNWRPETLLETQAWVKE